MHLLFTADEICDTLGQLSWFLVFCSRHQISLIKLREGIRGVARIAKTNILYFVLLKSKWACTQKPKSLKPQVPKYKIYPSSKCPSIHVPKFQSIQVPKFPSSQVPKIPNCQVSKFPSSGSPIWYLRLSVFRVIFIHFFFFTSFLGNLFPKSQFPMFLLRSHVPKFPKTYIGTYCCRLHQYEFPNALPDQTLRQS